MTREDYERYAAAFNARDYDTVFDFYAENPRMAFFGIEITTREQLRAFYTFLHRYVRETIAIERFASSDELAAVEGVIRIEGIEDLTRETLDANGMQQFFPGRERRGAGDAAIHSLPPERRQDRQRRLRAGFPTYFRPCGNFAYLK